MPLRNVLLLGVKGLPLINDNCLIILTDNFDISGCAECVKTINISIISAPMFSCAMMSLQTGK